MRRTSEDSMNAPAVVLLTLAFPFVAIAQASPPKPGPEHQKLAALVGSWTGEGECAQGQFGPAQKYSSKYKGEWFTGNFAVVAHIEEKGSVSGESVGMYLFAYDRGTKQYGWYMVDSTGEATFATGSISKDVLRFTWPISDKGKSYKGRGTLRGLGSDKHTWSSEYSADGKTWKAWCQVTYTRVKAN
jgi:hypothetical protein